MNKGDYLLVKVKPYGGSNEKRTVIIKLLGEFICSVNCMTSQPKWWRAKVIYTDTNTYTVGKEEVLCAPRIKDMDYEIISEEKAMAMVI